MKPDLPITKLQKALCTPTRSPPGWIAARRVFCYPVVLGRTLPSVTQLFYMEEAALLPYRRSLHPVERYAFEELMNAAQHHLSSTVYAAHTLPAELFLLAMLFEQYKTVRLVEQNLRRVYSLVEQF